MKYIKLYELYSDEDIKLTSFRRSVIGYGSLEDLKSEYSYSNPKDVEEIFGIIEHNVFSALVAQKMGEYDGEVGNGSAKPFIDFIKGLDGLSFENGEFKLGGIDEKDVIIKYISLFHN
tara:strand:+ start:987 stop:1340 length:354 start_codon:yes stop_codon:yes gene_type:complete